MYANVFVLMLLCDTTKFQTKRFFYRCLSLISQKVTSYCICFQFKKAISKRCNINTNQIINEVDNTNKIEAVEDDYLYVKTSQLANAGQGLFTAIPIYKDEVVAKFEGEILSAAEAKKRAERGVDKYFVNLLNGSIMDSMQTKCFAKYANDVKGAEQSLFKNNTKIALDDNDDVCLIAIKKIKLGEEIFCNYGKSYWAKHG